MFIFSPSQYSSVCFLHISTSGCNLLISLQWHVPACCGGVSSYSGLFERLLFNTRSWWGEQMRSLEVVKSLFPQEHLGPWEPVILVFSFFIFSGLIYRINSRDGPFICHREMRSGAKLPIFYFYFLAFKTLEWLCEYIYWNAVYFWPHTWIETPWAQVLSVLLTFGLLVWGCYVAHTGHLSRCLSWVNRISLYCPLWSPLKTPQTLCDQWWDHLNHGVQLKFKSGYLWWIWRREGWCFGKRCWICRRSGFKSWLCPYLGHFSGVTPAGDGDSRPQGVVPRLLGPRSPLCSQKLLLIQVMSFRLCLSVFTVLEIKPKKL